jgi:hypothetical protein
MLLRTLFALVLFTALAETMLHGVQALGLSALRREALLAVHAQIAAATEDAREAAARAVISGGDPRRLDPQPPPPVAGCRLRLRGECALDGRATVSFAPAPSPSPCADFACTVYEQGNDVVAEGRIDATIAAQALGPGGGVVASRVQSIVIRTLRVPPYAALAGQSDASDVAAGSPGDDAGAAPIGAAPGTLIDVLYQNAITGAVIPANVWQPTAESRNGATSWRP